MSGDFIRPDVTPHTRWESDTPDYTSIGIDVPLDELQGSTDVLRDVLLERVRQIQKFGVQSYPNGTAQLGTLDRRMADLARDVCQRAANDGELTWWHIFEEESLEARAESEDDKLRAELVQTAAVLVAWVEDIDRRKSDDS